ncbi:MAG: hypothetical protein QOG98_2174 [Pseudonocardiales bacterium]|nr:hypothetical protein [Pseudonocardiales bacterium]
MARGMSRYADGPPCRSATDTAPRAVTVARRQKWAPALRFGRGQLLLDLPRGRGAWPGRCGGSRDDDGDNDQCKGKEHRRSGHGHRGAVCQLGFRG